MPRTLALVAFTMVLACAPSPTVRPAPIAPRAVNCDLSGEWLGDGSDETGARYTFPLHLRQDGDAITGSIVWTGPSGLLGTEAVAGTIDCVHHTITLHTAGVEPPLVPGRYAITYDAFGVSLQGTWVGSDAGRGRFSAERR